jgi:hypothetical protein
MRLPQKAVTLTPEEIAELDQKLSTMRHNVNNQLALIVAASELIRRKPEMALRLVENIIEQPDRITKEIREFSNQFEDALGFTRSPMVTPSPMPS